MCTNVQSYLYKLLVALALLPCFLTDSIAGNYFSGRVVDARKGSPIRDAMVTVDERVETTDQDGQFKIAVSGTQVGIRAAGYQRRFVDTGDAGGPSDEIALTPITPRGLYLSVYGISEPVLREPVLELIDKTALNSVVIDIKGDRGIIPHDTSIKLAQDIGANSPLLLSDLPGLLKTLRDRDIYTIARIVVFKDNMLAEARPELAMKSSKGELWRDREGLAWTLPYSREVWAYNIAVAVEAARMGFDEIQFDYIRFPDERGPQYTIENTEANRVASITGFLALARQQLRPYNVFLAADLFGYVIWNSNDTHIGQRLEDMMPLLDYFSPMLYPSGFQFGIPGYEDPMGNPYAIVYQSLKRAAERTGLPTVRFRPWLQAFQDYAFGGRPFTASEVQSQINAAERFGSHGWMLWNPRNVYPPELFMTGQEMIRAESIQGGGG
jgi:hypothetical protein